MLFQIAQALTVSLSDSAKALVVEEGYDPAYGARPLKRVIQHGIIDQLAVEILDGRVQDGDHVLVDALGDDFVFTTMVFLFYDFIVERRQRKVMMAGK